MRFIVIGINDAAQQEELGLRNEELVRVIASHRVFSGGVRHHELVAALLPASYEWIDIKVPLDAVFARYQEHQQEEIVVFASGDPLFFGFANTIRNRMPEAQIQLYPTFNSLQLLAHQLVMPYQGMRIVSLTGRPWHELDRALIEQATQIGVLTDRVHTPATIAVRLLAYGFDNYRMAIGERLGNRTLQRIRQCTLEEATKLDYEQPNCLILTCEQPKPRLFGIPDKAFAHLDGREKMITKMPIRLLSLSLLDLRERSHFWDIGFCTGSVSIEAKTQFPHLHIEAFEIREAGRPLMEENVRRFHTPGIETHIGDFLEADLTSLAAPDAVFIGGHGGKLIEIVERITQRIS
ncbi:MAG: precorrin-6y C5,15-methyltransferase (decarboxylating) subunit CbiE, partial [Parabacteroides sp.]